MTEVPEQPLANGGAEGSQTPTDQVRLKGLRAAAVYPFKWWWRHVDTRFKKPPDDAEIPGGKPRWREKWPVPMRVATDIVWPLVRTPPYAFPQSQETIEQRIGTDDPELASELLQDALRLFDEAASDVDSIERRATTLQGTVAVAATVSVAGVGVVLDQTTISSHGWRVALAVGFGALVMFLVLTAFRALGATSRLLTYHTVGGREIFDRVKLNSVARVKSSRAAYLLYAYGRNAEVAQLKLWYLQKAAFWFRLALVTLVVLVVMVIVYAAHASAVHPPRFVHDQPQLSFRPGFGWRR